MSQTDENENNDRGKGEVGWEVGMGAVEAESNVKKKEGGKKGEKVGVKGCQ